MKSMLVPPLCVTAQRAAAAAVLLGLAAGCTTLPTKPPARNAAAEAQAARVVERDLSGAVARRAP